MSATESPAEILARLHAERAAAKPNAPPETHVAVSGGREIEPSLAQMDAFWRLFDRLGGTVLHHGAARGVDRAVAADARSRRPAVKVAAHLADWARFGRRAGPIRNGEMVAACPGGLINFPGGVGTENAVLTAKRAGRTVLAVEDELERERQSIELDHVDLGLWSCMENHTGT